MNSQQSEQNDSAHRGPLPPAILLVAIVLMLALHLVLPIGQVIVFPWRLIGAAPALLGVALNIWVDNLFRRADTTVKPFEPTAALVPTGPFLVTRNPMYLGMVLLLGGIAIGLGSATPWLVIPVFVWVVTRRFIVAEERKLENAFGRQYLDYKARVRRWL